eukprot:GEZU01009128.1.p4 GENE.GEZU01009128.1~~GEZU01009128.1.p4  ORF type:complete len:137 (+),score=34.12 GEZU01009128.1:1402-1812(+)
MPQTGGRTTVQSLSAEENLVLPGNQRYLLMQKLARGQPSKVVLLKNMVGRNEIDDQLETEVADECAKFGVVEKVLIYEEEQISKHLEPGVRIFVVFTNTQDATKALESLHDRWFGGRKVIAEFYNEDKFNHGEYTL